MPAAIADTGPIVAYFDRAEKHHSWVVNQIHKLDTPLLICEPVLSEIMFLLNRFPEAQKALFDLIENGAFSLAFSIKENIVPLKTLMNKYSDIPMSLADACVVRMAESYKNHKVFTLDSDFLFYRKNKHIALDLIYPQGTQE